MVGDFFIEVDFFADGDFLADDDFFTVVFFFVVFLAAILFTFWELYNCVLYKFRSFEEFKKGIDPMRFLRILSENAVFIFRMKEQVNV